MSKPIRIQRKRAKGFNLQAQSPDGRAVVSVCRPGKFGNPFHPITINCVCSQPCDCQQPAKWAKMYREWLTSYKLVVCSDFLEPLRGKHLACFCALDAPCHADVLLELANL